MKVQLYNFLGDPPAYSQREWDTIFEFAISLKEKKSTFNLYFSNWSNNLQCNGIVVIVIFQVMVKFQRKLGLGLA